MEVKSSQVKSSIRNVHSLVHAWADRTAETRGRAIRFPHFLLVKVHATQLWQVRKLRVRVQQDSDGGVLLLFIDLYQLQPLT